MCTFSEITHACWQPAFAIMQQTQPDTWSLDTFQQSLNPPNFAMQMLHDTQCIGFYIVQTLKTASFTEWNLEEIAVAPSVQGKGYGRILLKQLLQQALINHVDDIFLEVRASNTAAIGLYQSSGFVQIDVRKNYYPVNSNLCSNATHEDALIMRWQRCE